MPRQDQTDDAGIPDEAALWHLIGPEWWQPDERGGIRATSQAFQNRKESQAPSFLLADVVRSSGREAEDLVANMPGYGVVELTVRDIRSLGLEVIRDPDR